MIPPNVGYNAAKGERFYHYFVDDVKTKSKASMFIYERSLTLIRLDTPKGQYNITLSIDISASMRQSAAENNHDFIYQYLTETIDIYCPLPSERSAQLTRLHDMINEEPL